MRLFKGGHIALFSQGAVSDHVSTSLRRADYAKQATDAFERVKGLLSGQEGWTPLEHKHGADIAAHKKLLDGKSVEMVRAEGLVEGAQAEALRDRVFNQSFEEKKKGDESFLEEEILEEVDDNTRVLYQAYSAPWPLSNRDLVMLRSKWEENGVFYQVLRRMQSCTVSF